MEVAGWAGEGKEDGRVKLQKGCRKKNMQSRGRDGGNAPAPLGQTKLPSYSVSVWVWTSGPGADGLVCPGTPCTPCTPCQSWLVLCQPWPLRPALRSCVLLQLQPTLEGTDWAFGWGQAHFTLAFEDNRRQSKQAEQTALFCFCLVGMTRKSVKASRVGIIR